MSDEPPPGGAAEGTNPLHVTTTNFGDAGALITVSWVDHEGSRRWEGPIMWLHRRHPGCRPTLLVSPEPSDEPELYVEWNQPRRDVVWLNVERDELCRFDPSGDLTAATLEDLEDSALLNHRAAKRTLRRSLALDEDC